MDSTSPRPTTHRHRGLVILILLLFSREAGGQSLPDVSVYLQDEPIQTGDVFFTYIKLPAEYADDLGFGPSPVQDRLQYWGGPVRLAQDDPQYAVYRYSYRATEAGYTSLGPFILSIPNRTIQTETLLVSITIDGDLVPPELEWRIPYTTVYEGQTVYVSLDIHQTPEVLFPETLTVNSANDGIFEEVTGLGEISSYDFFGETFNRISLATFLYTPLRSGTLRIPDAEIQFTDYTRSVQAETIRVIPLPDSPESGAVGSFQLTVSPLPDTVVAGSEFLLEFTVSGTGNLSILKLPDISVVNASVENREEIADYMATEQGYTGSRIHSYRIRAGLSGEMRIITPEFAWFDPEQGVIRNSEQQIQRAGLTSDDRPKRQTFGEYAQQMELPENNLVNFSQKPIGAILFLSIPLYLIIYLAVSGKWYKKNDEGIVAENSKLSGNRKWNKRTIYGFAVFTLISLLAAVGIIRQIAPGSSSEEDLEEFYRLNDTDAAARVQGEQLLEQNPGNTALLLTLARLEYANNNAARAMFFMRRAVSLVPAHPELRKALSLLEEEMNLSNQYSIIRLIHGDWTYLVILLGLLLLAIYLAAIDFSPSWNVPSVIGGAICIALLATSLTVYYLYYQGVNNQAAVIREGGAVLKKIPDPDAADWIFIPEGTTVTAGVSASGYVQIQTAYGIVAWIPEEGIYD